MSYTKLFYHIVFRTYLSQKAITDNKKKRIFAYLQSMSESEKKWKLLRINAYLDHIHLLIEASPTEPISELVKRIKGATSHRFSSDPDFPYLQGWNRGYGAFTVGYGQLAEVKAYIDNQERHHANVSTESEIAEMIRLHGLAPSQYTEL